MKEPQKAWIWGVAAFLVAALLGSCVLAFAGTQLPQQDSNSLPPTNFSATEIDRSALPRPGPGFARATVAPNSQAPDARPVGERTCIACH